MGKEYDIKLAEYKKTPLCKEYAIRKQAFVKRMKYKKKESHKIAEKAEKLKNAQANGMNVDNNDENEESDDNDEEIEDNQNKNVKKIKLPKKPKDGNSPKKPLSGYFLFQNAKRSAFKAANPNSAQTDLCKKAGAEWKKMSAAQKEKYEKQSKRQKVKYEKNLQ